jgi:hypothetical protein
MRSPPTQIAYNVLRELRDVHGLDQDGDGMWEMRSGMITTYLAPSIRVSAIYQSA